VGVIAGRDAAALVALLELLLATVGRAAELEIVVADVDGDPDVVATLAALDGHLRGIRLPATTPRAAWDVVLGALTTSRALLVTPDVPLDGERLDALLLTAAAHPEADLVAPADADAPGDGDPRLDARLPGAPLLDQTVRTCLHARVAPLVLGLSPRVLVAASGDRRPAVVVTSDPQDLPLPDRFATR
jgi:hypothetical protein